MADRWFPVALFAERVKQLSDIEFGRERLRRFQLYSALTRQLQALPTPSLEALAVSFDWDTDKTAVPVMLEACRGRRDFSVDRLFSLAAGSRTRMKAFFQLSEVASFSDLPPALSLVPKLLELLMAWHPYAFLSRPGCDTGPRTGSLAILSVVDKLSLQSFLEDDAMELLLQHAFDCEPLSLTVTRLYEIGRIFPERQRQILRTVTARPLDKLQPKLVFLLFRVVQDWGANEDPAVLSRVQALVEELGDVEEDQNNGADADKLLQGQDIFFVDGISGVAALEATVVEVETALAAGLIVRVGVDAEWRDPRPLSLLQIAVQVDGGLVSVFLIDMIGHSDEVRRCCRRLLLNSRDESHIVLGFSPSEDLRRLCIARVFNAGEEYEPPSQLLVDGLPAGYANWIDLQCQKWSGFSGRMGLMSVVELALGLDLDKSLQVSDWDHRPLTREQMAYAALDASILLRLHVVLGAAALEGTAPSSASSAPTPDSAAEEQEAPRAGDVSEVRRRWRANVPDSSKVLARERHAGLRFLIPKPLSRLLRHLRGLGLDAVFIEDGTTPSALADMALEQDRQIVLPSYKRRLPKATEDRVIVLESRSPKKQVQEIVSAFGVQLTADCFCGRCGECNAWDWRSIGKEPSSMLRCRSSATSSVPKPGRLTRLCRCLQSTAPAPKWFARVCSPLGACGRRGLQQLRRRIWRRFLLPKVVPLSPLWKEARSLGSALRLVVRVEPVVSVPCWSVLAAVCCLLTTCCRPSPGSAQQVGLALGTNCPGSLHFRMRREQRAERPFFVGATLQLPRLL